MELLPQLGNISGNSNGTWIFTLHSGRYIHTEKVETLKHSLTYTQLSVLLEHSCYAMKRIAIVKY